MDLRGTTANSTPEDWKARMAQTHGKVVGVLLMNTVFGPRPEDTLDPQREVTDYWQVASPRAPLVIC